MRPIPVFIGYDERESIAYHVLAHSILKRSTCPVSIIPLRRETIQGSFTRPRGEKDATDFSNSRWIIPHLMGYEGWAIFMDCDMLMRGNIAELWIQRDDRYAVMVRKHEHVPRETTKFLGNVQEQYGRKNWSSLMLLNCAKLPMLTKHIVNTQHSGLWFHQFGFLPDDQIGDLPYGWNHLVDYHPYNEDAKLVHYTTFGPWHAPDRADLIDYGQEWVEECKTMLMGDNPHSLELMELVRQACTDSE